MNYFELYPGDYMRDTTRLSLIDHGAYLKLMMAYYGEEQPLPGPYDELYTIVAATSAADKAAVRKVADRYFPVGEDGLRRNKRADEEIAKAQKRIQTARENGAKNKPKANQPGNPTGHPAGYPSGGPAGTQRVTHSGEALHTPDPTIPPDSTQHAQRIQQGQTDAGRACLLMREAGCIATNPHHADLLAALAAGITPETLGATAAEAVELGKAKPFAWAIATARSRHAEGASAVATGPPRNGSPSKTLQAINALEAMKVDEPLAAERNPDRTAEARVALAGPNARR